MKAIALISGGLDSILAARLIKEQGFQVLPLNFKIPFCHRSKEPADKDDRIGALVQENLGEELQIIDISEDFLELLLRPKHGFGSNMNPCIDCKILMLSKAKEIMKEQEAGFIATGEVLGQRPMSQHRSALQIIDKESGLEGLVLRPLSARLLPETLPEKQGLVSRDKMLNFNGRSRRPQIELAGSFGIKEYATPAGGCLLTDPEFSKRLKELMAHKELSLDNIELLKFGRHFRISENVKLVVGRDEKENGGLAALARAGDYLFMPADNLTGPTCLARGPLNEELIKLSCSIACSYSDLNGSPSADIIFQKLPEKEDKLLNVTALPGSELVKMRI